MGLLLHENDELPLKPKLFNDDPGSETGGAQGSPPRRRTALPHTLRHTLQQLVASQGGGGGVLRVWGGEGKWREQVA